MSDRRYWPATERVAHEALRGQVEGVPFTAGQALRVSRALVDLLQSPGGARERQLVLGEGFTVVDRDGAHVFGFARKDGYCGWLPEGAVADGPAPSHWVASVGTHLYPEPRSASRELAALPMGARVQVVGRVDKWAVTTVGYVPFGHLRAIGDWWDDPVTVAEGFLGTPYLWGGNSRAGIDCSGLVQVAFAACGMVLGGDSDLQDSAGVAVEGPLRRGDLVFWKGHVALVVDAERLIHANGFTMSVAYEETGACIARIAAEGPVTAQRRVWG